MSRAFVLFSLLMIVIVACATTPQGTRIADYESSSSNRLISLLSGGPVVRGRQLPDVVLTDLNGKVVKVSDITGKQPTILLFSSTTCPYSQQEHAEVESAMVKLSKRAKAFTILLNETTSSAREYTRTHRVPGTVLVDPKSQTASAYRIEFVPTVVLVNSKGLVSHFRHFTPEEEMVNLVASVQREEQTMGSCGTTGGG